MPHLLDNQLIKQGQRGDFCMFVWVCVYMCRVCVKENYFGLSFVAQLGEACDVGCVQCIKVRLKLKS